MAERDTKSESAETAATAQTAGEAAQRADAANPSEAAPAAYAPQHLELDSNQIAQILPHRYPFALVDRIVDGELGSWARGTLNVSVMSPVFCGHFPSYHVLPGVLIVEALAQTAAVAVLAAPENQGKLGFFAEIKDARFKRQVRPGDTLDLEAHIVKTRASFAFVEGTARVDGAVAATAKLTLALGSDANAR